MIQVLRKATEILEHISRAGELSVTQLSTLTNEPKTTIYRLLSSLQQLGLVEPGSTRGSYRIGMKMLELGSAVLGRFDVREAALPLLRNLHDLTEQTVFLCIRRGNAAVCIEKLDGRWVRTMELGVGAALALHVGAVCRCLLAFEEREFWEDYVRNNDLVVKTPRTPRTRAELFPLLEEVRRDGYSIADGCTLIGMAGIGAPIRDARGHVTAALSISGPHQAILGDERQKNIDLVVTCASEISRLLGHQADLSELPAAPHAAAPASV
jgi:DNA-binding IclR family transcriptional regulator